MKSFLSRWPFLSGGGAMGELVREKDWSQTPLGAIDQWPQSLRTSVSTCLNSRFAILIWWGPELVMLYNDAYQQILGSKHPAALGMAGRDCWPEIWSIIGPMLEGVVERGEATWSDDLLLLLERHGYPEECYFTFSYSPIRDESGGIGGIFTPVHETTARVIGQRRLETLERLGKVSLKGKRVDETCVLAAQALSSNNADLPFVAIYTVNRAGTQAELAAHCGIAAGASATPVVIPLAKEPYTELGAAARTGSMEILPNGDASLPGGLWPVAPASLILAPILAPSQTATKGFLITGENTRKRLDRDYKVFLELVAQQLGHAIAEAEAFEHERQRAETLAALDRAKTAFFSNVSHEFRTPLTLMLGPLQEILDRPAEQVAAEDRQLLSLVQRNALRLQKLVNALLDFSRIEAGRISAQFEPVELGSLTTDLAGSFQSAMARAGLKFTVDCPWLREPVYVDEAMWEKVVLNLLSNAVKHTFEGSVTVRLRDCGEHAVLSVSDTGTGIPESELPLVFERFRRVDGSRARTHEGTGIGLALVQELVRLHGGEVSVTSVPDQGSTFTVSIPFGKDHLPPDCVRKTAGGATSSVRSNAYVEEALSWLPREFASPASFGEVPHRKGPEPAARVLLVDDNADMREYVARLLEPEYDVIFAANGQEALEAAIEQTPDLVLSDIMMPKLDGFGLLKELRGRQATRSMPVVFLSARAGEEETAEGREAGADDYIVKPFTARELTARIRGTLRIHQERRRAAEQMNQIFAQAPVAICVFRGPEFVFELANPKYEELIRGRELAGRRLEDVVPELDEEVWTALRRTFEEGVPFAKTEWYVAYDGDGDGRREDHWLNAVSHPLRDSDNNIWGVINVVHDITQMVAARKQLERVNRELEEFAHVASHDLQEPLRMVYAYSQLLVRRMGTASQEESQKYVDFIGTGVRRMERMIQDLLSFARTVQTEPTSGEPVRLADALSQALESLTVQMEEKHANLQVEHLPVVLGERTQFAQLFQNLLSNALKYSREGVAPFIRIEAQRDGTNWIVAIRDNGIGFEQEYAEQVFGLFKRLHRSEYPGTGLGLAICKRIVEHFGGRIWVESKPAEGSSFFFALRAAE